MSLDAKLIPKPVLRLIFRVAHRLRHSWRKWRKAPLRGVTMIARNSSGDVLLVQHSYGPQSWFLPGGGIHSREEPEAAARRELAEETGCIADHVRLVGLLEDEISGSPHTAYICEGVTDDDPVPDNREVIAARFFPLERLPADLGVPTKTRLDYWRERMRSEQG